MNHKESGRTDRQTNEIPRSACKIAVILDRDSDVVQLLELLHLPALVHLQLYYDFERKFTPRSAVKG